MHNFNIVPKPESRDKGRQALDSRLSTRNQAQRGFTLVELLVVITVIAILISLLGATLAFMGQQAKEKATNALIKKIHTQLEQRLEAFDRQIGLIENSPRVDPDYRRAEIIVQGKFPRITSAQRRILVRKELMRANFPQTLGNSDIYDSAEALYHMLTKLKVGESPPVDAGEFLASETADADNDGLLEFVDGWGNPLRFYRWPTRLFKHDGVTHNRTQAGLLIKGLPAHATTGTDLLDTDPDDPLGLIIPEGTSAEIIATFEDEYHTPNTYHIPLIVSAGPDGELGLFEPYDKANDGTWGHVDSNPGALTDNITNRNQRAGD